MLKLRQDAKLVVMHTSFRDWPWDQGNSETRPAVTPPTYGGTGSDIRHLRRLQLFIALVTSNSCTESSRHNLSAIVFTLRSTPCSLFQEYQTLN